MRKKSGLSILLSAAAAVSLLAGLAVPAAAEAAARVITDMAGREVEVPGTISRVYGSSPVGTNFMYTFDDEMLIGINYDLTDMEKKYTSDYFGQLPNLGGWYGKGNEGNIEEIIKAGPDIVLSSGADEVSISTADELQAKLGIPVVLIVTDDFNDMAASYRFLGSLFGQEERGEELAAYTEETYAAVQAIAEEIPEDERVTVYYAEGQDGLATDPSGSWHSRLIDICGGINAADCEITPGNGQTEVSMEQVIAWNPQYIIIWNNKGQGGGDIYGTMLTDPTWGTIQAVKDGNIYAAPVAPSCWFDRPPSCNTIIGLKWVSELLYPDYANFDIREEAKTFYRLFYHYDLTEEDLDELLANALPEERTAQAAA